MNSADSVEKVGYLQHDIVRKLKPSEPGRQELFRKTLEEKLEEDLEKRKKKRQQDEVVLDHDDGAAGNTDSHAETESWEEPPEQVEAADGKSGVDEASTLEAQPSAGPHIDVKA